MTGDLEKWLIVAEVAEMAGFTPRWIRNLCDRGKDFPNAQKRGDVWFIPTSDVTAWLEQRKQEAMDAGE
jgi:predicted DNA-binding transcriptional regulator AlpA